MSCKNFSLSIVSHGHREFIASLIEDLRRIGRSDFEVILTLNIPEQLDIDHERLPFPVTLIQNAVPKSFAENHNAAFTASQGDNFVVLNPDIRLINDPFDGLLDQLKTKPKSIGAPLIVNESGNLEDSARNFPTPLFLVKKLFNKLFKLGLNKDFVPLENDVSMPDWVAGMFIVVPRDVYKDLHGLDRRYRMYYEDVDFCARACLAGY